MAPIKVPKTTKPCKACALQGFACNAVIKRALPFVVPLFDAGEYVTALSVRSQLLIKVLRHLLITRH